MSGFSVSSLSRPELAELSAYLPDLAQYRIRLDANEAPPLMSEAAHRRIAEVLARGAWERYPDPSLAKLRQAIASSLGATPQEILPGVGSDEVISLLLTAFVQPLAPANVATVLTTTPSFVMYRMSARCRGLRVIEVPLDQNWDLSVDALRSAIQMAPPSLVFIASPNNPTGNLMSRDRLEQLIDQPRVEGRKPVEAEIQALLREGAEELQETLCVDLPGRAQPERPAVAEDDVDGLSDDRRHRPLL